MPSSRSHSDCDRSATNVKPEARAARSSCSRTTSAVTSCAAGRVERRAAALVRPVGAQPADGRRPGHPARQDPAGVVDVVDGNQRAVPEQTAAGREPVLDPARDRKARSAGNGDPVGDRVERAGVVGFGGYEHLGELAARAERDPHLEPAARRSDSAIPNGRLSSSSLASTTPVISSAGSSSSATNTGPEPADRYGRVFARLLHEGSERLVGRLELESRRVAPPGARPTPRPARSAARAAHSGCARNTSRASRPLPAPASITTNGSGSSSSCQHRSSARATHAPNSEPTSGLVTKSRPARPAPRPEAKNPISGSYRATSTKRSNGIGPSRRMRRPIASVALPARTPAPRSARTAAGIRRSRPRPRPSARSRPRARAERGSASDRPRPARRTTSCEPRAK